MNEKVVESKWNFFNEVKLLAENAAEQNYLSLSKHVRWAKVKYIHTYIYFI